MSTVRVPLQVRSTRSHGIRTVQGRLPTTTAQAAYNTARRIEAGARRRAPVRTGHLRSSIERYKVSEGDHVVVVKAHYGIYVEYGTRHMAAQPYFRPAVAEARAYYMDELRKAFR